MRNLLWVLFVFACILFLDASKSNFEFSSTFQGEKAIKIDNYAVVIDAGSTGSRCFVFRVVLDFEDDRSVTGFPCGKVVPGLSSFADYSEKSGEYLAPLLINAAGIIPSSKHATTVVHIKATAGMRLLPEDTQQQILHSLVQDLNNRMDVPFSISEYNVGTINGHEEAFFAVLASNYIHGSIDGNLHPVEGMPMLGALDMGGSSTQLIFYHGTNDAKKIHADDFWSHSWLNYGVDRIQERVLAHLLSTQHKATHHQWSLPLNPDGTTQTPTNTDHLIPDHPVKDNDDDYKMQPIIIPNPCAFKEYLRTWSEDARYVFRGTGDGVACMHLIERVIWAETDHGCTRGRPCPIDSIEHPSVHGHHFYAMSVYFYALDCMRQLGPALIPHWPTPTLTELETAAFAFCGWQWDTLLHTFVTDNTHPYTRVAQLHDRCFETLYIITLLEKGFGFDRHARGITYALEVGGSEVEWTLGFALAEVDFHPHRDDPSLADSRDTATATTTSMTPRQSWRESLDDLLREMLQFFPFQI